MSGEATLTTISFLDSSTLTKLFINELASPILRDFVRASRDGLNAFSILAEVEVRSALHRRLRNREITKSELYEAQAELAHLSQRWFRLGLDDRVVELASGVIARHALRSLDALQLASALSLKEVLWPDEQFLFIAADKRLLTAAAAEGLAVWNPEASAPPATIPPVN